MSTMPYLQINIYFMIIIYLVELTTTDTLNIHTLTNIPPKPRQTKPSQTQTESKYVQMCVQCTQSLKANVITFLCVAENISSILTFMASNSKRSNLLLMCVCVFLSIHPCHWCPCHAKKRNTNQTKNHTQRTDRQCVRMSCWFPADKNRLSECIRK